MSDIYDFLVKMEFKFIVEIGCEKMEDTARLRALFPKSKIHCFDPDYRNAQWINKHRKDEELAVKYYAVALANFIGESPFYLSKLTVPPIDASDDWTASSSLKRPKVFDLKPQENRITFSPFRVAVFCSTLDSYAFPAIDFIWMDAQSSEDMVIEGGKETFARTKYLYTEHCTSGDYENEPGLEGIMKLLPGWETIATWPYDVLLKNPNA